MHPHEYRVRLSDLPDYAIARLPVVCDATGLKRSTIYSLAAEGRFPSPIKLTSHSSGWKVGAVKAWLSDPTGWRASDAA